MHTYRLVGMQSDHDYHTMYVCMYVCMYVRTYVRMYVCMHVCMYACSYVCMYTDLRCWECCCTVLKPGLTPRSWFVSCTSFTDAVFIAFWIYSVEGAPWRVLMIYLHSIN